MHSQVCNNKGFHSGVKWPDLIFCVISELTSLLNYIQHIPTANEMWEHGTWNIMFHWNNWTLCAYKRVMCGCYTWKQTVNKVWPDMRVTPRMSPSFRILCFLDLQKWGNHCTQSFMAEVSDVRSTSHFIISEQIVNWLQGITVSPQMTQTVNPHLWLAVMMPCKVSRAVSARSVTARDIGRGRRGPKCTTSDYLYPSQRNSFKLWTNYQKIPNCPDAPSFWVGVF